MGIFDSLASSLVSGWIKTRLGASVLDSKWFHVVIGIVIGILGVLGTTKWDDLLNAHQAAEVMAAIAFVKVVVSSLSAAEKTVPTKAELKKR